MRKLLCLFILTCSIAFSQATIKKDLFYLFIKIPPLPTNSKEAYGKGIREGGEGGAEAKYSYEVELFDPLFAEIQKLNMETAKPSAPKIAGVENPEELAKKMEKMSEEEKMKVAMEMMKGMQAGPREIHESPEVMNAVREFDELNTVLAQEQNNDLKYSMNDRMGPLNKKFSEMDERTHKMICEKFPSYCEEIGISSFSDAKREADNAGASKMLRQNWNEKNSLFDKELIVVRGDLAKRVTLWKTRLTPFNEALRKASFGADAKDQAMIQILSNGQQRILGGIQELATSSNRVWAFAAGLYDEKVRLEKRIVELEKK
jgi:hypothetical protein